MPNRFETHKPLVLSQVLLRPRIFGAREVSDLEDRQVETQIIIRSMCTQWSASSLPAWDVCAPAELARAMSHKAAPKIATPKEVNPFFNLVVPLSLVRHWSASPTASIAHLTRGATEPRCR